MQPFTLRLGFIALLLASCAPILRAQDPFDSDLRKRSTASTPIPFGVIVNGSYPAYDLTNRDITGSSGGTIARTAEYGAEIYYDSWQAGFQKKKYGSVGVLTFRTATRDVYTGWYLEAGSAEVTVHNASRQKKDTGFTKTVYGFGIRGAIGPRSIGFQLLYDIVLGSAAADFNHSIYVDLQYGVGYRIPIATTSLALGATISLGYLPITEVTQGSPNFGDVGNALGIGFGLRAAYAFNFQKQ